MTDPSRYPFAPRSNRHLRAGQYWALPLRNGRFACGRVMAVPAFGPRDRVGVLPVEWRRITDEGIQIGNSTYNTAELGPYRHQHSGVIAKRDRWEVHYDPYDVSQVHLRTPDGWITAAWTHLPMVSAPFADFTWRHARRLAGTGATETDVARVLDELLTRAEHGPNRASTRITARTRAGRSATARPCPNPRLRRPSTSPTARMPRSSRSGCSTPRSKPNGENEGNRAAEAEPRLDFALQHSDVYRRPRRG
ncbi:Mu transposase C-terminal domain-containing protein [Micromonospora kangleipakensis]|uniref:Mu transposase C-terminal domain-containing protein n=1 Tax=Micromonospora kangleipakensis TaxID=1077942 RepID=UPI001F5E9D70|nr:Mu transposase C-terminal domain-containing protein [Micromonospora kangleipakensis]